MKEYTESDKSLGKRKLVWVLNIVVALACIVAMVCYFFGPAWQINLTYTITAAQFEEMIEKSNLGDIDVDVHEVIGEDGEKISVSLSLTASHIFGSFGSAEETVNKIIDDNVDTIAAQLTKDTNVIAKKMVKSAAKNTVKKEVKNNIQKFLQANKEDTEVTEQEVEEKLNELGFTDDYIGQKTDELIDDVFEGGGDIDSVTENIMDTVEDVYADFQKNAEGKEGYEEFLGVELSEEDKAEIEKSVKDTLKELAAEDGTIDPDEMIAELLAKALSETSDNQGNGDDESRGDVASLAAEVAANEETGSASGSDKLASALKDVINKYVNDDVRRYAVYAFYGMAGLMLLSMIPWVYILIKLIVKAATKSQDPTVKLAIPIWLGWLFFLLLVAIPTIALWIMKMPFVWGKLSSIPALSQIGDINQISFSITSLSWVSALCALIAFGISIYYMVVRRQLKKAASAPAEGYYGVGIPEEEENPTAESAPAEEPKAEEPVAEPTAESAPAEEPKAEEPPAESQTEEANAGMQEEVAVSEHGTENGQN